MMLHGSGGTMKMFKLERPRVLRIEVAEDAPLRFTVFRGIVDIFGYQLPEGCWFTFPPGFNFSVFAWAPSVIQMDFDAAKHYTYLAPQSAIESYMNAHYNLDSQRYDALCEASCQGQGPRVIVVGPTDSGNCSLSRMLLSWASGWASNKPKPGCWKPTFVDLNVGRGSITIPGCIAATPIEEPINPVEGFPLQMSVVYFYGHATPRDNVELCKVLVNELAETLERQFAENDEYRAAGMVINTMGWTEGGGYELLLHAIRTLKASTVLVLGQKDLCSLLQPDVPGVNVQDLPMLGADVYRNSEFCQKGRSYKIRKYSDGLANDHLSLHSNIANFSDLFVYRVGGVGPATDPNRVAPVEISHDLLHSVLSVSFAKEPGEIISSKVAGFIYVTDIDINRKKITYLSPFIELPSKYLAIGSLACHAPSEA